MPPSNPFQAASEKFDAVRQWMESADRPFTPMANALGELMDTLSKLTEIEGAKYGDSGKDDGRLGTGEPAGYPERGLDGAAVSLGDALGTSGGGKLSSAIGGGIEGRPEELYIPNQPPVAIHFEVTDIMDVKPSHIPESGFLKNQEYFENDQPENKGDKVENERQYDVEPASQDKVRSHSANLQPALMIQTPADCSTGAPVCDRMGNVLGGNSRVMSLRLAYVKGGHQPESYKKALLKAAPFFGIPQEDVLKYKQPILIRRLDKDLPRSDRKALISVLNESFTAARDPRAEGKSRGDRLKPSVVNFMNQRLRDSGASTLREFFDTEESRDVVDELFASGVFQAEERNRFTDIQGMLNSHGKEMLETALRGRLARNYEILSRLPNLVVKKIDAAVLNFLKLEGTRGVKGSKWSLMEDFNAALSLVVDFFMKKQKNSKLTPELFLNSGIMEAVETEDGGTDAVQTSLAEKNTKQAQILFKILAASKTISEFSKRLLEYAKQADAVFNQPLMVPPSQKEAFFKTFGWEDWVEAKRKFLRDVADGKHDGDPRKTLLNKIEEVRAAWKKRKMDYDIRLYVEPALNRVKSLGA